MDNREIDALIAENVMGHPKPKQLPNVIYNRMRVGGWELSLITCSPPLWKALPYSTDPVASKALRDRMRELGWALVMSSSLPLKYFVEFSKVVDNTWVGARTYQSLSDTEEMAVVLAALAALGITGKAGE